MVVVKIEVWPHGDSTRARNIGGMVIVNDGTGTDELGNYEVHLMHAGKFVGRKGFWKTARLDGYRRALSPYHMIAKALNACRIR